MSFFRSLDAVRAYMAWWVAIGHAVALGAIGDQLPPLLTRVLTAGKVPVGVFTILSGFVITNILMQHKDRFDAYLIKRFFRLYPVYLISLAAALLAREAYRVAFIESAFAGVSTSKAAGWNAESAQLLSHALLHLTLLHGAIPNSVMNFAQGTILTPAWSISLEWQFYLVAPAIVPLFLTLRSLLIAILLVASCLALHHTLSIPYSPFPSFLPLSFHLFAIGIASRIWLHLLLRLSPTRWLLLSSTVSLLCSLFSSGMAVVIWTGCLVLLRAEQLIDADPPLNNQESLAMRLYRCLFLSPPIRALGSASYSTYLLHVPIITVFCWSSLQIYPNTLAAFSFAALLGLLATIPASLLCYRIVELRFIQKGREMAATRNNTI